MVKNVRAFQGQLGKILLAGMIVLPMLASPASAQTDDYPSQPIKLIVPFSAGGGNDAIARALGNLLSESLGQSVVVENQPGAGGKIGVDNGLRAKPDGYTLTLISNSYAVNPSLYKLDYDPVKDITPIGMIAKAPFFVSVHPSVKADSLADLLELARRQPGQLSYASSGAGGISHLATELLLQATDTKMVHVPYRGSAPAMTDTIAGHTQMMLTTAGSTLPYQKEGKLKVLAVTLPERVSTAKDIPTVKEQGVPYEVTVWYGIIGPKGIPESIQLKLNKAINKAVQQGELAKRLKTTGEEAAPGTPQDFQQQITTEIDLWKGVVKKGGITIS
ncbi:MAG TPA: tripartite tricarboxylate transporter substrate binding protein [Eoetvoesiella sp.]